jgi:ubiquitin-protein ligase
MMRRLAYEDADATPDENDLLKWTGMFLGPEGTPWE